MTKSKMQVYGDLEFFGGPASIDSMLSNIEAALTDGWTRGIEAEETVGPRWRRQDALFSLRTP